MAFAKTNTLLVKFMLLRLHVATLQLDNDVSATAPSRLVAAPKIHY